MKFRTEGLIIKEQNIGEQDKLIHALTKSHGVVKAFVRGAKSLKTGKGAATSLLSYAMLTFHTGRESYSVSDMCLAQYFCELALTACPREKPADVFLSLFLNALYLLDSGKRPPSLVKPCLEMRLTALSGYLPDLVMCRGCGVYAAPVMYFYPRTGEIACDRCGSLSGGAVALSEAALTALRHTVYAEENKLFSFALSDEGLEQLNRASEAYVQHRFEKEFKTLQFYHTMKEP